MLIRVFPPHYQLVCANSYASSFSVISYVAKEPVLHGKRASFALQNRHYYNAKQFLSLFTDKIFTKRKPFEGKINWQKISPLYMLPK